MSAIGTRAAAVLAAFGLLATASAGCVMHHYHHPRSPAVVVDRSEAGGPPPWAPAHGHRRKHPHVDVELIFDTGLGVYVVVGYPNHYWDGDHFFRWIEGRWQISADFHNGWAAVRSQNLPPGLAKKYGAHPGKGKGHGPPAKHGY